MADNQDSDEIQYLSRRLETVTTSENIASPRSGSNNQSAARAPMESRNNNETVRVKQEVPGVKSEEAGDEGAGVFPSVFQPVNLPERIILIIDVTKDQNCTKFKLGTGATYMPLFMIKRVVEIFVNAKSMINRNHQFAVMTLYQDTMKWICDFTSNTKVVLIALDALAEKPIEEEESFDLGELFEFLETHVPPAGFDSVGDVPAYVTRAILIYSRSNCVPRFQTGRHYFELLSENPYFFLDCLYVHEPPSEDNKCEEVYTELSALDAKNYSYIFEVGRNATKLHDNMAKLLAHPLQRPLQRSASYSIAAPAITVAEEIHTNV